MTKDEFINKWGYDIEQSRKEIEMDDDLTLLLNQHLHNFINWHNEIYRNNKYISNSEIGKFNLSKPNKP